MLNAHQHPLQRTIAQVAGVFFLGWRYITEYSRYKNEADKKYHHDIDTGYNTKLFEQSTCSKRKHSKSNGCSNIAEQSNNAHFTYHIQQGFTLDDVYVARCYLLCISRHGFPTHMVFVEEINTVGNANYNNQRRYKCIKQCDLIAKQMHGTQRPYNAHDNYCKRYQNGSCASEKKYERNGCQQQ